MISLSYLNKLILFVILFIVITFNSSFAEDEPADIWQDNENQNEKVNQTFNDQDTTIESPILSDDVNKEVVKIDEDNLQESRQSVIGIFDPEKNNFNLNMWSQTDGEDIKKILKRIDKLKLAKLSEDLLFQTLFTNAYPPGKNLKSVLVIPKGSNCADIAEVTLIICGFAEIIFNFSHRPFFPSKGFC